MNCTDISLGTCSTGRRRVWSCAKSRAITTSWWETRIHMRMLLMHLRSACHQAKKQLHHDKDRGKKPVITSSLTLSFFTELFYRLLLKTPTPWWWCKHPTLSCRTPRIIITFTTYENESPLRTNRYCEVKEKVRLVGQIYRKARASSKFLNTVSKNGRINKGIKLRDN